MNVEDCYQSGCWLWLGVFSYHRVLSAHLCGRGKGLTGY